MKSLEDMMSQAPNPPKQKRKKFDLSPLTHEDQVSLPAHIGMREALLHIISARSSDDSSASVPAAEIRPGNANSASASWCHGSAKQEIAEIVGKRIIGVMVKENSRLTPPRQVFLIFDDGTNFEFYADSTVTWTTGIRPGGVDWVRDYCAATHQIRFEHVEPKDTEGM